MSRMEKKITQFCKECNRYDEPFIRTVKAVMESIERLIELDTELAHQAVSLNISLLDFMKTLCQNNNNKSKPV